MHPLFCGLLIVFVALKVQGENLRKETFDKDPNWEGFNNRVPPKKVPVVVQKFGYSATHFAGKSAGEIGGQIWRSSTRALYAAKIEPKTLNEKLQASGSFAIFQRLRSRPPRRCTRRPVLLGVVEWPGNETITVRRSGSLTGGRGIKNEPRYLDCYEF